MLKQGLPPPTPEDNAVTLPPPEGKGIVLRALGGLYTIRSDVGLIEILAKPRGIFRKQNRQLLPGDRVCYAPSGDVDIPYRIEALEPRHNVLLRPPLANLDCMLITISRTQPEPDFLLVDKLILYCVALGIEIVLLLTKEDLGAADDPANNNQLALQDEWRAYEHAGFTIFSSRLDTDNGMNQFLDWLAKRKTGWTLAMAGPSGVGKSSFFNRLTESRHMEVGEVSKRLQRGKHTTRHVDLLPFQQGYLVDTPGFSLLDLSKLPVDISFLPEAYPEFKELAERCHFGSCRHQQEPACAVRSFVEENAFAIGRYKRYSILLEQLEEAARHDYTRRKN